MWIGSSLVILYLSKDAGALAESTQSTTFAQLDHRESKILGALQNHPGISLQLFGIQDVLDSGAMSKNAKRVVYQSFVRKVRVYANIYGPVSLFKPIGVFASKVKVFLQDPECCDRNVQYHNPQRRFPGHDGVQYTQSMKVVQPAEPEVEEICKPCDLFAHLQCDCDLAESESLKTLETPLCP